MLAVEEKWMDKVRCVFPWDEEEDEGDTRESVNLGAHVKGEIKTSHVLSMLPSEHRND